MSEAKSHSFAGSLGLLIIRAMVGVVFIYHGSQKLFGAFEGPGMEGFTQGIVKMGLPMPEVNAYLAAGSEFFGGILLIVGLFTRLASIPLLVTMLVASFVVHKDAFSLQHKGMEYALTLACVCAGIALLGPGCFSLDALFFGKKKPVTEAKA
jgi:putative oxidoreductase